MREETADFIRGRRLPRPGRSHEPAHGAIHVHERRSGQGLRSLWSEGHGVREGPARSDTARRHPHDLGSLLTINAHSNQTSPVHRGKLVRERFLCDQMPPPPPNVMTIAPEPNPSSTARERFAQHSSQHGLLGLPLAHGPHRLRLRELRRRRPLPHRRKRQAHRRQRDDRQERRRRQLRTAPST